MSGQRESNSHAYFPLGSIHHFPREIQVFPTVDNNVVFRLRSDQNRMSSVHRDNRGKTPYWIGAFTDEFGRRRKRSTETTDKRQAKAIVEGWQKAVDEARGGRLTEIKARQIVNEILERTTGRKLYAPTAQG
jgi:hypothetical protein